MKINVERRYIWTSVHTVVWLLVYQD